jgi:hypothetical protein
MKVSPEPVGIPAAVAPLVVVQRDVERDRVLISRNTAVASIAIVVAVR